MVVSFRSFSAKRILTTVRGWKTGVRMARRTLNLVVLVPLLVFSACKSGRGHGSDRHGQKGR